MVGSRSRQAKGNAPAVETGGQKKARGTNVRAPEKGRSWPWGRELPHHRLARIRERERQIEARAVRIRDLLREEINRLASRRAALVRAREEVQPFVNEEMSRLIAAEAGARATQDEIDTLLITLDRFIREPTTK